MKIQKFVAPTMPEAMKLVRQRLGQDAVILYTKNVKRKGMLKWFNKNDIEVVAALDSLTDPEKSKPLPLQAEHSIMPMFQQEELKPEKPVESKRSKGDSEWASPLPGELKKIYKGLLGDGLWPRFADGLIQDMLKSWYTADESLSKKDLSQALTQAALSRLEGVQFEGLTYKCRILNLVGPTGVGKTTTAAKLASKAVLDDKKSVAFITTDTYRIAAVDQLKTYAKILNIPVAVAYSTNDFKQALDTFKDKDLIIVDSAGRNYQQTKYIHELKALIPFDQTMHTYLVLSSTSKVEDLDRLSRQFNDIPVTHYVFTKVDETASIGSLFNIIFEKRADVAYISNGQNVPDDLMEADKEAFCRQLIEGVFNG